MDGYPRPPPLGSTPKGPRPHPLGELSQDAIDHFFFMNQSVAYIAVASAACVLFDHITTFDMEIELIWSRPKWTFVRILFLINRYCGDILHIMASYSFVDHSSRYPSPTCPIFGYSHGILIVLVICSMQGIMVYRISSMYNHSKKIIMLLAGAFFLEVLSIFSIQVSAFKVHYPVPGPAPGLQFCTYASIPPWYWAIWIPITSFELLMLGLTVRVAYFYYKTVSMQESIGVLEPRQKSLAYVLFRDSILYPFLSMLVCIANFISWLRFSHSAIQITVDIAAWLPCILGCRLILNLREAYYLPFDKEIQDSEEDENATEDVPLQVIGGFAPEEGACSPRGSSTSVLQPRSPSISSRIVPDQGSKPIPLTP